MIRYDLFSSTVYKVRIPPESYDKQGIVSTLLHNYAIDPSRNKWDDVSSLHHTYSDWDNPLFKPVKCEDLQNQYHNVISEFISVIPFSKDISYEHYLANFTVNTKYMKEHDHFSKKGDRQSFFACAHYLKFDKHSHGGTSFSNPNMFSYYSDNTKSIADLLQNNEIVNSSYYDSWDLDCEEDDMIIFPSHLKHFVVGRNVSEQNPRIVAAINIDLMINNSK